LISDSIKGSDIKNPSFISDLESVSPVVESVYLTQNDSQSLAVFVSCLKLRVSLALSLSKEIAEADSELCRRLKQTENDLNDLITVIQAEWRTSKSKILNDIAPKWRDSISRMILNVSYLRHGSAVLSQRPILYISAEAYFVRLIEALHFFDNSNSLGIDVSQIHYQLMTRLNETRRFIWARPRSFSLPSQFCNLPFFEKDFDFGQFRDGFTRISPTREITHPVAKVVARLLDLLRRSFNIRESVLYCLDVADLLIDVNIQLADALQRPSPPEWPEFMADLEQRISGLRVHGVDPEPSTPPGQQRLVVVVLMLDLLTKLYELELTTFYETRVSCPLLEVRMASAVFDRELRKIFDGKMQPLPEQVDSFPALCGQLRPFLNDLWSVLRQLAKFEGHPPAEYEFSEDSVDALKFIPKRKASHNSLLSLFSSYYSEFTKRRTEAFVDNFVKFFLTAITVPILKAITVSLKEELVLFLTALEAKSTDQVQRGLRRITDLNRIISRRVYLLESDEFELLAAILSLNLMNFRVDELTGPELLVSECICDLGVAFLSWIKKRPGQPSTHEVERVRELGVVFEELIEMCILNRIAFNETTKAKFHELIDGVFKAVPCYVMGSFAPKMKLLLFLFHSQNNGSP
jgi:hypothetical protein